MRFLLLLAALALVGPRVAPEREKALKANGGTKKTEEIVDRGLDWLLRHQDPKGLWDADGFPSRCAKDGKKCEGIGKGQHGEKIPCPFDHSVSALATLAFLGHGHGPDAEGDARGKLVARAMKRLDQPRGPWALALSTQVFAEAEAMEGKGRWTKTAHSLAKALLARRQKDGGFGYAAGFRPGSDVPYTALAVQALVAARDAGFTLPADFASGVDGYLDGLEVKGGKLAYLKNGRAYGYTPTSSNAHAAVAIRELLRVGTGGKRHKAHLALVLSQKPVWKISFREVAVPGRGKVPVQIGNLSMYQWWYGTVGLFQRGGADWSGWFSKTKSALVKHQQKSGCARGSWDPKGTYERQTGGRVFATALGVLMLEQPYRHRRMK
jgi:hypothetical protein